MPSGETVAHRQLKHHALRWAVEHGFPLAAVEVRVPRSGYRADVVAATAKPTGPSGRIALFECKQSRADFLRDRGEDGPLKESASALSQRLGELRSLLAVHRPDLRRGESLFAEFDEYDFQGLRHDGLHAVERELTQIQRKLFSAVKFARLCRYAAADHLYLVTEEEILGAHEIPLGWGWLARTGDQLVLRLPPTRHETIAEHRLVWLERIAAAASRECQKAHGVQRVFQREQIPTQVLSGKAGCS